MRVASNAARTGRMLTPELEKKKQEQRREVQHEAWRYPRTCDPAGGTVDPADARAGAVPVVPAARSGDARNGRAHAGARSRRGGAADPDPRPDASADDRARALAATLRRRASRGTLRLASRRAARRLPDLPPGVLRSARRRGALRRASAAQAGEHRRP